MSNIIPFRGFLYNKQLVKIEDVAAPPYDVITAEERVNLIRKSEYNITRLILPEEKNDSDIVDKYVQAARQIHRWTDNKIIVKDQDPSFYVYTQDYEYKGEKKIRLGFIGLLEIEELSNKNVYPHEYTFDAPREDRFKLLAETKTNLSPIFALYTNDQGEIRRLFFENINRECPYFEVFDENNVRHRLWAVSDRVVLDKVVSLMQDKEIFIADGHHRYEAARMYYEHRRRTDKKGQDTNRYNYVMMCFVGLGDEGLMISPTHRLIKKDVDLSELNRQLKDYFNIDEKRDLKDMLNELAACADIAIGMYSLQGFFLLRLKDQTVLADLMQDVPAIWKKIDTAVLNKVILEKIINVSIKDRESIEFSNLAEKAVKSVDEGKSKVCFFLNPAKSSKLQEIAISGERMPEKSTYFYPKLLSGLVINRF
ncbi:MAG: DUF1015 domain-containing protein [Candidatus Omnitrophota bacterium]